MATKKKPVRRRHVPQRTCIACRRVGDKRELVRIVHSKEHGVQIDPTGKQSGRGAYLCRAQACWEKALKGALLDRALKTSVNREDLAALRTFAADLPNVLEDVTVTSNSQLMPDEGK